MPEKENHWIFFYGSGKNPKETYERHGMKFDVGNVYAVTKDQLEFLKPMIGFFEVLDIIEKIQNPKFLVKNTTTCSHGIESGIYCKRCEKGK